MCKCPDDIAKVSPMELPKGLRSEMDSPNTISVQYAVTWSKRTWWSCNMSNVEEAEIVSFWHQTGFSNSDAFMLVQRKSLEKAFPFRVNQVKGLSRAFSHSQLRNSGNTEEKFLFLVDILLGIH